VNPKLCLVGIDGLRLDIGLSDGAAPTVSDLVRTSAHASMVMDVPTLSGPGWASILTGRSHEEHGVYDNSFVGHRLLVCPDLLSRAFYANQTTKTFAAAGWPPLVDPVGIGPVIHQRREQERAGLHQVIVRDGETYGYRQADGEVADVSVATLAKRGPDVSFIYFCETDEAGHVYGAVTTGYREAIGRVDAHLARITAAIRARVESTPEEWLLVLTSDHGHLDAGGHGGGEPEVTQSFAIAHSFAGAMENWPHQMHPTDLVPLLLSYLSGS